MVMDHGTLQHRGMALNTAVQMVSLLHSISLEQEQQLDKTFGLLIQGLDEMCAISPCLMFPHKHCTALGKTVACSLATSSSSKWKRIHIIVPGPVASLLGWLAGGTAIAILTSFDRWKPYLPCHVHLVY